jgi:hypothetical protein
MCLCRCPFHLQQFIIPPSYHDDHVVGRLPYFNFSIKHVNEMALLSNVHKRQQVPLQLRKIKKIMQKKIWESKQFEPDAANSCKFETGSIYKVQCTLDIVIQFFKKIICNVTWQVAPMLSNHTSLQESNEALNKSSFMPI